MQRSHRQAGSALLVSLLFMGILIGGGAITFSVLENRYRQVHQNAAWQEALVASESGIDLAVNEMRKDLFDSTNAWAGWSTDNGTPTTNPDPSATPVYYTSNVLLRAGEGGQNSYAKIAVDAPAFLRDSTGEQWYRVRSLGVAAVSGGAIVAGDKIDLRLRKFDLRTDSRTGLRLLNPQATRLIEAIVKPVGTFRLVLFGVQTINLNNQNIMVDSYDSRDPAKSTNGQYDPAKRQENGNIATNGNLIQAGSAHVYGDAATNGGTVLNASNVTGEIRTDFYQELFAVTRPVVTADAGTPTTVTGSSVIAAKPGAPTQVVLSRISLSGQSVLRISGAADGSATFAQIVVSGDVSTSGQSQIQVDPGVHVRIFVTGDIDIGGNGVINTNSPLNLQMYGVDRPAGSDGAPTNPGSMKIAGNGAFRGTLYAPSYNVTMVGGGNADSIFGSFVGWTVAMTGIQTVHYDEALADGGLVSDFKVVSWFEDSK